MMADGSNTVEKLPETKASFSAKCDSTPTAWPRKCFLSVCASCFTHCISAACAPLSPSPSCRSALGPEGRCTCAGTSLSPPYCGPTHHVTPESTSDNADTEQTISVCCTALRWK